MKPYRCIKPLCGPDCCQCNCAVTQEVYDEFLNLHMKNCALIEKDERLEWSRLHNEKNICALCAGIGENAKTAWEQRDDAKRHAERQFTAGQKTFKEAMGEPIAWVVYSNATETDPAEFFHVLEDAKALFDLCLPEDFPVLLPLYMMPVPPGG